MTELEQQLAAYTDFLEERSVARSADHTPNQQGKGDVIVVDLMERRNTDGSAGLDTARGRRTKPLLLLAAAAVVLIVAVVSLLNTGEEGTTDVVTDPDVPVEPDPVIDAAIAVPDVIGDVIAAYEAGDEAALEAIHSSELAAVLEGVEVGPEIAYPLFTSTAWRDLAPWTWSDCGDPVTSGVVSCRFSLDFAPLIGVDLKQPGAIEYTIEDSIITSLTLTSDDYAAAVAGYAPYYEWASRTWPGAASQGFFDDGGIIFGPETAPNHRSLSEQYLALGPLKGDWSQFDEFYNTAIDSGDQTGFGEIFSLAMTANLDGIDVRAPGGINLLTNAGAIATFPRSYSDCELSGSTLTCGLEILHPMLPGIPDHVGTAVFEIDGDRVVGMAEETNRDVVHPILEDYYDWTVANYPADVVGSMWTGRGFMSGGESGVQNHMELGPLYLASLDG